MTNLYAFLKLNFKKTLTFVVSLGIIAGSLVSVTPAHAALDGDGTGWIDCTTGRVIVTTNVVTDNEGCSGDLVIPEGITGVGEHAIYMSYEITSVSFPASLISIGADAFAYSDKLTRFNFSGNAPTVGIAAFDGVGSNATASIMDTALFYTTDDGSTRLSSTGDVWNRLLIVRSPDVACSNGGFVDLVDYTTFDESLVATTHTEVARNYACTGTVEIPSGVSVIASNAFLCSTITQITLPATLTSIGVDAFKDASQLANYIFLGDLPLADPLAFAGHPRFATASISSSIASLSGRVTGEEWYSLILVKDPSFVCSAGGYVTVDFSTNTVEDGYTCQGRANIPDSILAIGLEAFMRAPWLNSVTFGDSSSLQKIDAGAFSGTAITTITLPAGVTSIGDSAFAGSATLANISFKSASAPTVGNFAFAGLPDFARATFLDLDPSGSIPGDYSIWEGLLVVPASDITDVFACGTTGHFLVITVGSVSYLDDSSSDCEGTVTIPAFVNEISANAFLNNSGVTSVSFATGSRATHIGAASFAYMMNLASLELPSGLLSIDSSAFDSDWKLTSIVFPSSLEFLGDYSFAGTGLTNINFNGNAPDIGLSIGEDPSNPFAYVPEQAIIHIAHDATGFGGSGDRWYGLSVLKSPDLACSEVGFVEVSGTVVRNGSTCHGFVEIPSAITEIAPRAFADSSVGSLIFGDEDAALSIIGDSAFEGALNLEYLFITANVEEIGANAFRNTPSLNRFVVSVSNANFESSTDSVLFNKSMTKLVSYPAASTQSAYNLPSTVTEISESAFYNASNIREIVFPGNAPTVGADAFYGTGTLSTPALAKIGVSSTGFGTGTTWNSLTINRASAPTIGTDSGSVVIIPPVTTPVVSVVKTNVKQLTLAEVLLKVATNGTPILRGKAASKFVGFLSGSTKLDANDLKIINAAAERYAGMKGTLVVVGFTKLNGISASTAKRVALYRARAVASSLAQVGGVESVGYASFGVRNKLNPSNTDNRVEIRWIAG